jgi:hypothetical protein
MKAVLMNSADKLKDPGTSEYIGMEKEILKTDGMSNWLSSDARDEPGPDAATTARRQALPLDSQMGTGQLNVSRALKQFTPGQIPPDAPAATQRAIGWDYRAMSQGLVKYTLPKLKAGTYISLTLTWDRPVTLNEMGTANSRYDVGETFTAGALADLDLYLMRAGEMNPNNALWASTSKVDSVEHIFYKMTEETQVEIWVRPGTAIPASHADPTNYALAWWGHATPTKAGAAIPNDGSAQRSMVTSLTVPFDGLVSFVGAPTAAFRLTRVGPDAPTGDVTLAVDLSGSTATQTVARLTFSGSFTQFGSLIDGNYSLTVFGAQVLDVYGRELDGNGDGTVGGDGYAALFRLFGDGSGDRQVDNFDFYQFSQTYNRSVGDPLYLAYYDINADGVVNFIDHNQFQLRFGVVLPPP